MIEAVASQAEQLDKVGIGLCADLEHARTGLDVSALRRRLERSAPDVSVEVVPDLCRRPEQTAELASRSGAKRLVLGLCDRESATHEFQTWARKAGLDPFALELVILGGRAQEPDGALALLEGALAKQRAFAGSEPEQIRPRFMSEEWRLSRRSLVTLPPLTYEAVASIGASCLGERQCGLCAPACPASAIKTVDGRLAVDRTDCTACGICVTACPVGAIDFPGSSVAQFEAQLGALLPTGRRLVLTCRTGAPTLDQVGNGAHSPGWLALELPCLGMVPPGWVLQALAGGAPAVGLLSCGAHCRSGRQTELEARVAYIREMLELLGEDSPSNRVSMLPHDPVELSQALNGPPLPAVEGPHSITLTEPAATASALGKLADRDGIASGVFLAHEASPLGLVTLEEETCTSCGTCASACPTGALAAEENDQSLALSYDAGLCLSCERCVEACPEAARGALRVSAETDLAALRRGRVVVKRGTLARCRSCGRPIAPIAMLDRIRTLLADDDAADKLMDDKLMETLGELCNDCRGSAMRPAQAS